MAARFGSGILDRCNSGVPHLTPSPNLVWYLSWVQEQSRFKSGRRHQRRPVAQWQRHLFLKQDFVGSNPSRSIVFLWCSGSTSVFGTEGQDSSSCRNICSIRSAVKDAGFSTRRPRVRIPYRACARRVCRNDTWLSTTENGVQFLGRAFGIVIYVVRCWLVEPANRVQVPTIP